MKIQQFSSEEEWLKARLGRVTGTRASDLILKKTGGYKIGFYEILAERIALPATGENVMDRGHRLEKDALDRFATETQKKLNTDLVIWSREENENIALSPDGYVEPKKAAKGKKANPITEAVECKCLSSARHIEAFLTKKIPSDYEGQKIQYFVTNEDLQTLYFVFYDPRMPKDFFWIEVTRESIQEDIEIYLNAEKVALEQLERLENELTF